MCFCLIKGELNAKRESFMKVSLLWSLSILYISLCFTNVLLLRSWSVLPLYLIFNKYPPPPPGVGGCVLFFCQKVSLLWSLSILYVPLCITNIPLLRSWCVLPLCLIFNKRFVRWGWWMYYIILL